VEGPSGTSPDPAETLNGGRATPPATQAAEPRQRLRVTLAREPVSADRVGRAALDAWQECLEASGLPVAGLEISNGRARLAIAAPLPAIARGTAELVDLWLLERLPVWRIREALAPRLPAEYRWVAAEDVWLGAPPLPGQVAAADWRIELGDAPGVDLERLRAASNELLDAASLPRTRIKAGAEKPYDLRPLILDLAVEQGTPMTLRLRTRIDPELGSGRPEEVLAAFSQVVGATLNVVAVVRTRILLADDLRVGRPRPGY
jgi:uncharacterized protein (DUF2344 family)